MYSVLEDDRINAVMDGEEGVPCSRCCKVTRMNPVLCFDVSSKSELNACEPCLRQLLGTLREDAAKTAILGGLAETPSVLSSVVLSETFPSPPWVSWDPEMWVEGVYDWEGGSWCPRCQSMRCEPTLSFGDSYTTAHDVLSLCSTCIEVLLVQVRSDAMASALQSTPF